MRWEQSQKSLSNVSAAAAAPVSPSALSAGHPPSFWTEGQYFSVGSLPGVFGPLLAAVFGAAASTWKAHYKTHKHTRN